MSSKDRENLNQNDDHRNDNPWEVCPTGELTQMVHRLDASQRRARSKQVYGTALVSTGVFACVVLALGSFMGPSGNHYGDISCSTCRNHIPDYALHLTGELVLENVDLVASMKTHLEKCSFCRARYNALYPNSQLTLGKPEDETVSRPAKSACESACDADCHATDVFYRS